jgi:hypothetical protein
MKRLSLWMVLVATVMAMPAMSQVPQTMSYQGVLTDNAGAIPPDGAYNFTFRIYDHPTLSGANLLWTENHNNITVNRGGFSVILGMGTPAVPLTIAFDRQYYLGISVALAPAAPGTELLPRVILASSPYSLNTRSGGGGLGGSGTVNTVPKFTAATTLGNSSIFETGGNVGIGTTSPGRTLDVAGEINARTGYIAGSAYTGGFGTVLTVPLYSRTRLLSSYWSASTGDYVDIEVPGNDGAANRLRITSHGGVGIGTTDPAATLDVNGSIIERSPAHWFACSTSEPLYWNPATGHIGLPDIPCGPNMRNVTQLSNSADILNLNPVKFTLDGSDVQDIGLVPEDVSKSVKDLVRFDKDGKPSAVKYDRLSLYLLEVVKTQQKAIEGLRTEVEHLKNR